MASAIYNNNDAIVVLLTHGASSSLRDHFGLTAFDHAVEAKKFDLAQTLKALNTTTIRRLTPSRRHQLLAIARRDRQRRQSDADRDRRGN
jgi:ankyrin repeat protein